MSIFKKLIIPIVLLTIVLQIMMTSLYISSQKELMFKETNSSMMNNLTIIERSFNQLIEDYSVLAKILLNDENISTYIYNSKTDNLEILNGALESISQVKKQTDLLNNIFIMPSDGFVEINVIEGIRNSRYDHTPRQSFKEIVENSDQDIYIEKPKAGVVNNRPIFNIYALEYHEDDFIGAVGLPVSMHDYTKNVIMTAVTDEDMLAYLMDSSGFIIGAVDETMIYNEAFNLSSVHPQVFETIKEMSNGRIENELFGIDAWIQFRYISYLDTYIILSKDLQTYQDTVTAGIQYSIMISLLALAIIVLVIYMTISKITKPLHEIADYSKFASDRVLKVGFEDRLLNRSDEIGTLSRSLQEMLTELDCSFEELEEKSNEIEYLANHDALTRLPNRRYFKKKVTELIKNEKKGKLLMMDIDDFKLVNDSMGHVVGDEVLVKIAELLIKLSNENIIVSRFGGDEFIIWLNDDERSNRTEVFINNLTESLKESIYIGYAKVDITFSIGICRYPDDARDLNGLIRYADLALYTTKKKGKKSYRYFNKDMESKMVKQFSTEHLLEDAVKHNNFYVVYQPQIDLSTGEVVAYEALIRLHNSQLTPNDFIPVSENTGQIIAIGRFVAEAVCKQLREWLDKGEAVKPVSINYSVYQLRDIGFVAFLEEQLEKYQIDPSLIEFELTENVFLEQLDKAIEFFDELLSMGIKISVDDFGTGYSSLTYVINLPISKIKLDKYLCDVLLIEEKLKIMKSIIDLSHSIDLYVVAEGIESKEQVELLRSIGCDAIQGFYFSEPLEAESAFERIER